MIKPFTMHAIAYLFLGVLLQQFIRVNAVNLIKIPFGIDLNGPLNKKINN
jgi:ACR3 family arsenite transporter